VEPQPRERDGGVWRRGEERKALFPARAGTLRIPGASLRCDGAATPVPGATLEVQPLPDGAPPGFAGAVGGVRILTRLEPEQIRLGESARLWVVLRGPGNLWTVPPPLAEDDLEGVDVFAEPPATELDADDELRVRRTFRYQLVPRRAGRVTLPPVRVAWFDPAAGAYRLARAPARTLTVRGTAIVPSEE
jgi:hypothetical protein